MAKKKLSLSIIVPLYNEEESLEIFLIKLYETIKILNLTFEVIFIDDGSTDYTLNKLLKLKATYKEIKIIEFSRNFGKESALAAGLEYSKYQVCIPIDVDLQDPPELIPKMINKWEMGYDVVLAKRNNRQNDSFFKRISSNLFYKFHNKISHHKIPDNVGDFRLLDRKVVDSINSLPESKRFMKGIFSWVGYQTTYIDYKRDFRKLGKSKFDGWKLWNFALDGFTSYSTTPLRIWTYIGFFFSLISLIFAFYIIFKVFFFGVDVPGYASLVVAITFLSSLQLIGIGIIGEYLGRTYIELKQRPSFIVNKIYE